jgi:Zn-dependent protease with chaperone function
MVVATFYFAGFFGEIPWYYLIIFTVVLNFIIWLVSPYISDWIYRFLYKVEWIGIDGLRKLDSGFADFIEEVCKSKKIKVPKIGYIADDNPQAFTYGSAAFNARMVLLW